MVNVTSDAAVEGYEGWGGYGSSKAALEQLSNVLAAEEPEVQRVLVRSRATCAPQMHQDAFPGEDISDRPLPETVVPAVTTPAADGATERPVPRQRTCCRCRRERRARSTPDAHVEPAVVRPARPPRGR